MKMDVEIENNITVEEYNKLRKSISWNEHSEDRVENAIRGSVFVKKATINGKTIGMARAIGDGIYYFIVDVIVNPEYQKRGIGKKLIEAIVKEVESRTEKGQKSSINLVSMKGKEEFYEKCGFKKVPFEYTGYGMIRRIVK